MSAELLRISDGIEKAIGILKEFEKNPKAQECLDIYRRLPENKQDTLLIVMDAFTLGMEAGRNLREER